MNFKEWCQHVYGITYFSEGKITPKVLLPVYPRASVMTNSLVDHFGGYAVTTAEGERGLVFTQRNYNLLIERLRSNYSHQGKYAINEEEFGKWEGQFFADLGVDVTEQKEYRTNPPIHITLENPTVEKQFLTRFAHCNPRIRTNPITGLPSVEMPSRFIDELYGLYYQGQHSAIQTTVDVRALETHKVELQQLQNDIEQHKLYQRLDKARKLSLDYGNSKSKLNNQIFEAASAYAFSLKAFAVINKDNLSPIEYTNLLYASKLLANYGPHGTLQQSLKTDANFVDHLERRVYGPSAKGYMQHYDTQGALPLIRDLPILQQRNLLHLINTNAGQLLDGASGVSLGKGKSFTMQRFLPDDHMQSETDIIVLQTGGVQGHSTMVELVKVGRLADGSLAGPHERPHYYDYYKVDHNLGYGSHEADDKEGTCLGTYITKIRPCTIDGSGQFIPHAVDPSLDPYHYQQAMAFTLQELIKTEREILFYRPPGNTKSDAPINSREAAEWERLTQIRKFLSGHHYEWPIAYTLPSDFNSQPYQRIIRNEKGYLQQSGSCTIFSIKSLVSSIIGHELMTLHADFMQTHTGNGYVRTLQGRIAYLDARMMALQTLEIKGTEVDVHRWVGEFMHYLGNPREMPGLYIKPSEVHGESILCILDKDLQKHWRAFAESYKQKQVPAYPRFFDARSPTQRLETNGLEILQALPLPGAKSISVAMKANDIQKPGCQVIKLRCSSFSETDRLRDVIESLTTRTPAITVTPEGYLLLGENRMRVLCEKLGVSGGLLIRSLPSEEELTQETDFRPFVQYGK